MTYKRSLVEGCRRRGVAKRTSRRLTSDLQTLTGPELQHSYLPTTLADRLGTILFDVLQIPASTQPLRHSLPTQ
ncbi:uncharacterized protein LY79DRAFT_250660 [Colletotrichum navitas]|uniref:Uncharacterized protein n=1 Tax=Colletotrichum navitas TaxID=681940 RepID=A0AAD8V8V3_9PEZI|nr:uncharacterized protein LY79DRAFT_250660 [Colletotrichum navitas]KAK1598637.1 hypothetical protein LY79DRAFT_250660 [Colletotrichum navitas]